MIILRKGPAPSVPVVLGDGAVAMVRPATVFQFDVAMAKAGRMLAGVIEAQNPTAIAVQTLGNDFAAADFTTRHWIEAAAKHLALIELAHLCTESWSGVGDDEGKPIETPNKEMLALLLRSREIASRFQAAVESPYHQRMETGR